MPLMTLSRYYSVALSATLVLLAGCTSLTTQQRQQGERAGRRMAAAYDTPAHDDFFFRGGSNAVLFVHGFPGSPAQLHPIAEVLHSDGWTAQGILMPGSGRDISRLSSLSGTEWRSTIQTTVADLSAKYERVLVVAYSMGAAMTCASLSPNDVDGLVLIAPYQWKESLLDRITWTFFRPMMPDFYRPFRKSDLSDPDVRAQLAKYFPEDHLDTPEGQQDIRSIALPLRMIATLRTTVRSAYGSKWEGSQVPILMIQGAEDTIVDPRRSRSLAQRWGGLTRYEEIAGDHLIVETTSPAFPSVLSNVCTFARERAIAKPMAGPSIQAGEQ
jgi:esterase/lipase